MEYPNCGVVEGRCMFSISLLVYESIIKSLSLLSSNIVFGNDRFYLCFENKVDQKGFVICLLYTLAKTYVLLALL